MKRRGFLKGLFGGAATVLASKAIPTAPPSVAAAPVSPPVPLEVPPNIVPSAVTPSEQETLDAIKARALDILEGVDQSPPGEIERLRKAGSYWKRKAQRQVATVTSGYLQTGQPYWISGSPSTSMMVYMPTDCASTSAGLSYTISNCFYSSMASTETTISSSW